MYPSAEEISGFFESFEKRWPVSIRETLGVTELEITSGDKTAVVSWHSQFPEDLWYAFINGDSWEYDDWTEMFEQEKSPDAHFEYVRMLVQRYLDRPTRLRRRFIICGQWQLQYEKDGVWADIRSISNHKPDSEVA